jgi:hypothetical protein
MFATCDSASYLIYWRARRDSNPRPPGSNFDFSAENSPTTSSAVVPGGRYPINTFEDIGIPPPYGLDAALSVESRTKLLGRRQLFHWKCDQADCEVP